MYLIFRLALAVALLSGSSLACLAAEKKGASAKGTRTAAEMEAATRLQVFLDRANFGPGKLDGYYGSSTLTRTSWSN